MAKLHRDFLNLPGATDVITFDLGTDLRKRFVEGEIVVCSAVAARIAKSRCGATLDGFQFEPQAQAREGLTKRVSTRQKPTRSRLGLGSFELERELVLYVIHGMLHLAGFDDHKLTAFRKMHAREDEILSQLSYSKMLIAKSPDLTQMDLTDQSIID